jgi:hypothetical protein
MISNRETMDLNVSLGCPLSGSLSGLFFAVAIEGSQSDYTTG